jgi:hypothetical protein
MPVTAEQKGRPATPRRRPSDRDSLFDSSAAAAAVADQSVDLWNDMIQPGSGGTMRSAVSP